jgi:hypothetical protein
MVSSQAQWFLNISMRLKMMHIFEVDPTIKRNELITTTSKRIDLFLMSTKSTNVLGSFNIYESNDIRIRLR